jgi:acetyl-CoA carboxylase carboxyl transferase subunit alpha
MEQTRRKVYGNLNPWQRVQLARHPRRPYSGLHRHALR